MNMLFGNTSLLDDVRVIDAEFPNSYLTAFGGPRVGLCGFRTVTGASRRALTATALKPQGLASWELAKSC
jgi:ribulose-bisphosphate carboxylase large chain